MESVQKTKRHPAEYAIAATGIVLTLGSLAYFGLIASDQSKSAGDDKRAQVAAATTLMPGLERGIDMQVAEPTYRPPARVRQAYVIPEGERVGVPEGTSAEVLAKLTPLAEAGDGRAALGIYNKLSHCRSALASGINDAEMAAYKNAGVDEAEFLRRIEKDQEDCAGGQEQMNARGKWLEQAAAAGSIEAQLMYLSDADAVIGGGPSGAIKSPERAREFKAKGLAYLEQLVSSGNIDAMMHLRDVYDAGFVVERDPVRAYALTLTVDRARPGLYPPELLRSERAELAPKELARAESLAAQIYSSCCDGR